MYLDKAIFFHVVGIDVFLISPWKQFVVTQGARNEYLQQYMFSLRKKQIYAVGTYWSASN